MGNLEKCRKFKAGDRYCLLYMGEKLHIASNNNPNELLNQRSEILNAWKHKKGLAPMLIKCRFGWGYANVLNFSGGHFYNKMFGPTLFS